ncbi:crossover junction endodeoxyribonuclease RuvC [Candidatus Kaiserbacteria bacterium]|nr:crossover junction endodeoxyribonuclease RuvC [Candidatus Kaiserbacteria bacterium]
MRVLAFDPGYERLGAAVLEKENGKKEILLHSECIRTSAKLDFSKRLMELGAAAEALIKKWKPDAVALEEVFFEKNAKTAMQVAEVRGALAYIAASKGLVVHHYTPGEVKIAVTGYGRASKADILLMVPKLLALPPRVRLDDEVDAIAVGITCLASVR